MKPTKKEINKYFDENGIAFSVLTAFIQVSVDFSEADDESFVANVSEVKELDPNTEDNKEIKIYTPFDISDDEVNELALSYIYDTTGISIPNVNLLPKYKTLNGKPFLIELQPDSSNIHRRYVFPWGNLNGDVFFRGDKEEDYKELPKIKIINGNISIYDSKLESLGELENVTGDFIFSVSKELQINGKTKLKTLSPLKHVGGNLVIRGSSIKSLGTLKVVQGNVSLRYSQVKDFGDLKYIGGNLLISKYNLEYLNTEGITILGKVRVYNDPIISPYI
jgi:hypothetical protein